MRCKGKIQNSEKDSFFYQYNIYIMFMKTVPETMIQCF